LSVVILSDKLTSMLSITANQIPKVSERFGDLRPDKSFQSFESIHPPSPPDSNRINNSNGSESENSGNDDNFILRKRKKQKTSKSARLNNIRKWLIENAPIQKSRQLCSGARHAPGLSCRHPRLQPIVE
jgi:hypothetical protein